MNPRRSPAAVRAVLKTMCRDSAYRGGATLTPAASRMLAKLHDAAYLTCPSPCSSSAARMLAAALREKVVVTRHHNDELRVELPVLTLDNHERASTIICAEHPEWGAKRFTADASGRGHHGHGTGSNSAVLFESDFGRWRVASWLPSAGPGRTT